MIIYLAGLITSDADPGEHYTITYARAVPRAREASRIGGIIVRMGFAVISPFWSCDHPDNFHPNISQARWYEQNLLTLNKCDAICMLPGWEASLGATGELAHARVAKLKLYEWTDDNLVEMEV